MTNDQIEAELKNATSDERRMTRKIVELIAEAVRRRIWAERGYSTAHRWLVKKFGYSDSAAGRRLDAARLLGVVPEIASKLETGEPTLCALSKVQSAFYAEEKRRKESLPTDLKREIIAKVGSLSSAGVARLLAIEFPEVHRAPRDSLKPIGTDAWLLTVSLNAQQMADIKRSRELLSHTHPDASWGEVLSHLACEHAKRTDPVQRAERRATRQPTAATVQCGIPRSLRDAVIARAGGACEFRDPRTKARCGSRVRVEVDHLVPKALGGSDEQSNLNCLCAVHNRLKAVHDLGLHWASAWKRGPQATA